MESGMYEPEDMTAVLREHPRLQRPRFVVGPHLRFRQATPGDARFILSLRLDPAKNAHLSPVADDLEAQTRWLRECATDPGQIYFIIEGPDGKCGTVRLYDQRGTSFSWGSWILTDEAPKSAAIESTLMVYALGLDLGFSSAHFDVRKANEKVWQYHQRLGAKRTGEDADSFLYAIGTPEILAAFDKYRSRLEPPIRIEWS